MSCVPYKTTYRLLDAYAGWCEVAPTASLVGFHSPEGLRLADTGAVDCNAWIRWIGSPRLAWDCRRCRGILVTPRPSRVMKLGPCDTEWHAYWTRGCEPLDMGELGAVAAHGERFAVADRTLGAVHHFATRGGRFLGSTLARTPKLLAYTSDEQLVVCSERGNLALLQVIDRNFRVCREYQVEVPAGSRVLAMRAYRRTLWLVHEASAGDTRLTRVNLDTGVATSATLSELKRTLTPLPFAAVSADSFCIARGRQEQEPVRLCFSWYGRCLGASQNTPTMKPCAPRYVAQGELVTETLDSGIVDCQWHRITLDADVPETAQLLVSCATSAAPDAAAGTLEWWNPEVAGATDFLVMRPPGRYLHLHISFRGDGYSTPRLRRARLEFPRATSLKDLPPVFREGGRSDDFTDRFLALFDSMVEDIDDSIENMPALFDLRNTPDEALPWLGTWLDVAYDPRWSAQVRRRVLQSIPALYPRRGTPFGVRQAAQLVLGEHVEVQELGPERAFGALGYQARLGTVRAFGRATSRVRLGTSPLGSASLRSFGNPDRDALNANAFRFRVLAGVAADASDQAQQRLSDLIGTQKPAHTVEQIRMRRSMWQVGSASAVGVDTAFSALPAPVLGTAGNIKLGRSVVAAGARPSARALVAGARIGVGINTHLE